MRINPTTPLHHPYPPVAPAAQGSTQPSRLPPPTAPSQHQYFAPPAAQQNRNRGNYDPTQRPDDPYIGNVNSPSFNKEQAVWQLTRETKKWEDWNQNNKTEVSYYFTRERGMEFNYHQKQDARRSLQSWADAANLTFTENGGQAEGRLTFRISDSVDYAAGQYPHTRDEDSQAGDTRYKPYAVQRPVLTHEIGHALGLLHPGEYNRGDPNSSARVYAQDSKAHALMSYYTAEDSGKSAKDRPLAPMMDDISAIQHFYGANYQTRRENNTYGFNSNTGRDYYSLRNAQDAAYFCIWDGAGNDTLDVSGYRTNQVVNLRAGSFSDVGNGRGNVSIARGVVIENAIGGSGHDVLIGNAADNRLTGGAGADRMRGGGGADSFVYNHASDSTPANPDVIMDFNSGTDKIDLSGLERRSNAKFKPVQAFSGRIGDTILGFNPQTQLYFISIDLTGNRTADFVVTSTQLIRTGDVLVS